MVYCFDCLCLSTVIQTVLKILFNNKLSCRKWITITAVFIISSFLEVAYSKSDLLIFPIRSFLKTHELPLRCSSKYSVKFLFIMEISMDQQNELRIGKMSLLSCELFDILQKYYSAITCFYMFICFLFTLRANIKSSDEGGRMISLKYKYMQFRLIQAKYF